MKVVVALIILSFLGLAYATEATGTLYAKCESDKGCKPGLKCKEIWSDCYGDKQCVCEDDPYDRSQFYILSAQKCYHWARYGGVCNCDGQCGTKAECRNETCVCKQGKSCLDDKKKNGEACAKDEDCSYFDPVWWTYWKGNCTDKKCGCPDTRDMHGEDCNLRPGPLKQGEKCIIYDLDQCNEGLYCRMCSGYKQSDGTCRAKNVQAMIHASVSLIVAMLGISLLKM